MADERQYEPPIFMAWLAQHGFVLAIFGPTLLVSIFINSNTAFFTFLVYIFTCLFLGAFAAYLWSRNAPTRVLPIIKNDWPSKYAWKRYKIFLYTFLTLLNVVLYFSFIQNFPLEWSSKLIVFLGKLVFFVFIMAHLGLRIAGVMNGDAKVLSEAG